MIWHLITPFSGQSSCFIYIRLIHYIRDPKKIRCKSGIQKTTISNQREDKASSHRFPMTIDAFCVNFPSEVEYTLYSFWVLILRIFGDNVTASEMKMNRKKSIDSLESGTHSQTIYICIDSKFWRRKKKRTSHTHIPHICGSACARWMIINHLVFHSSAYMMV